MRTAAQVVCRDRLDASFLLMFIGGLAFILPLLEGMQYGFEMEQKLSASGNAFSFVGCVLTSLALRLFFSRKRPLDLLEKLLCGFILLKGAEQFLFLVGVM